MRNLSKLLHPKLELFYHYPFIIIYIDAALRGLARELATVERVPRIV